MTDYFTPKKLDTIEAYCKLVTNEMRIDEYTSFCFLARPDLLRFVKAYRVVLKRIEELETASLDGFR